MNWLEISQLVIAGLVVSTLTALCLARFMSINPPEDEPEGSPWGEVVSPINARTLSHTDKDHP